MSREWSAEQRAIFEHFARDEDGNGVVIARAGTGKTTTIIEALKHSNARAPILCAFNKRIAEELKRKVDGRAEVKTLHGIGFSIIMRFWEGVNVDAKRGSDLAREAAGIDSPDPMVAKVAKLAALGKGLGLAPGDTRLYDALLDLAVAHDVTPDDEWIECGWTVERIASLASTAMELARRREQRPRIDFDDMIYLPIANNWARPRYDLVVVDEAQDMNAAQLELARRVAMPSKPLSVGDRPGRIVVVGDDRQAIYGFRGADSDALARLQRELCAKVMTLTTTYRCGKAIVDQAQRLVPDFRAHESNGPGEIVTLPSGMATLLEAAEVGDFVLSRKNAPLVRVCLRLLRKGKAARIEGRDIASGLKTLAKRWKVSTIGQLLERIDAWQRRELAKLAKRNEPGAKDRAAVVTDQAEVLVALCEGLTAPAELLARIDAMFGDSETDRRPTVVCSSIHRAKGLEADRVFILKETLYPNRNAKLPDPIEEKNLEYVAITRAKKTLVWVNSIAE